MASSNEMELSHLVKVGRILYTWVKQMFLFSDFTTFSFYTDSNLEKKISQITLIRKKTLNPVIHAIMTNQYEARAPGNRKACV